MTTTTQSTVARRSIAVPALGLAERTVLEQLGLTWGQLQPLYSHVIGAPRDYVFRRHGTVFTAEGVRRLVAHFDLPIEVNAESAEPLDPPSVTLGTNRGGRRHFQGPWYLDFQ